MKILKIGLKSPQVNQHSKYGDVQQFFFVSEYGFELSSITLRSSK